MTQVMFKIIQISIMKQIISKGQQMNTLIKEVMTPEPITVNAEQNLKYALDIMLKNDVRHLPVLKGNQLIGILSERDIRFLESYEKIDPSELIIEEAFTEGAYKVTSDTKVAQACDYMAQRKISSALVVDQGKLVGIFTWIDALKMISKTKES